MRDASATIFGKPLVTNVYRSVLVEAMVAAALPAWNWCSADYFEYDFLHADGTRLEVKQSAMRQSWEAQSLPRPQWDIAERKTVFRDNKRISAPGRNADLYVLGLHDIMDETADHREPVQWKFFVVPAFRLPVARSISLGPIKRLVNPVDVHGLADAVGQACRDLSTRQRMTWQPGDLQRS